MCQWAAVIPLRPACLCKVRTRHNRVDYLPSRETLAGGVVPTFHLKMMPVGDMGRTEARHSSFLGVGE